MHNKAPDPGRESTDLFWPAAFKWATPPITCGAEWNTRLHENYIALSDEWQTFVGRRIKEDFRLLQELASANSPEVMCSAYARFWQKAVEDYWREYATMATLASGFVGSGMAVMQHTFEEAKPSLSKAA
jgi:hypothetical protein